MRKKTEFYLACDNVSRFWLVMFCFPVCCLRAILSYMHVVVYCDNTKCVNLARKLLATIHSSTYGICGPWFVQYYIAITGYYYNKDCFSTTEFVQGTTYSVHRQKNIA